MDGDENKAVVPIQGKSYSPIVAVDTMAQLSILYAQNHRKYHNLNHIMMCLAACDDYYDNREKGNFDYSKQDVVYMIWFHDAVYNPYAVHPSNEHQSASLWDMHCRSSGHVHSANSTADVYDGIIASAYHTYDQPSLTISQQVFLDCDLHGLASDYSVFIANGEDILEEYKHLPRTLLVENRHHFMKTLLKRKRLFYTDFFYKKYESRARHNIEAYLRGEEVKENM